MSAGKRAAAAALAAVGARFRLHGRDPATGLDCVGVAALALAAAGRCPRVPTGYPLRGGDVGRVAAVLDARCARGDGKREGDLILAVPGPGQLHLAVRVAGGLVHADAGLGRVVRRPGEPAWPVVAAWTMGTQAGEG